MQLKHLGILFAAGVAAVATAAAAIDTVGRPFKPIAYTDYNSLHKICDEGRAVYFVAGYYGTAVSVVPDAPECARYQR